MVATTKVFIMTKFPKRQQKADDQTYLCYEDTTPPWDKELFHVKDESSRCWFCHLSDIELNREALQALADRVKEDYSPRTEEAMRKRLHNPLVVQIVICRAETLEELRGLLGVVKLQRPSRGAA